MDKNGGPDNNMVTKTPRRTVFSVALTAREETLFREAAERLNLPMGTLAREILLRVTRDFRDFSIVTNASGVFLTGGGGGVFLTGGDESSSGRLPKLSQKQLSAFIAELPVPPNPKGKKKTNTTADTTASDDVTSDDVASDEPFDEEAAAALYNKMVEQAFSDPDEGGGN